MNLDNQNLAQVSQELKTIRDYIRWAFSLFNGAHLHFGHGTDNAWDEAVYLVLSALHLPPDVTPDLMNARLTLVERRHLCDYIFQRIDQRIPAAYLTQEAWFAGLPFYIDKRVIIPRSPIAELIENGFSPWLDNQPVDHILDLCTGSGCIAIAAALAFPEAEVDAVDICDDALEVAKINVTKHHVTDQITLIKSNLFENIKRKYDLIISNPPYVSPEEYDALPREFSHEPTLALKADNHGNEIAKQILKNAADHLTPGGILIVEVGNAAEFLIADLPVVPFLWLDFERGGDGVFLLTKSQLDAHQALLNEM